MGASQSADFCKLSIISGTDMSTQHPFDPLESLLLKIILRAYSICNMKIGMMRRFPTESAFRRTCRTIGQQSIKILALEDSLPFTYFALAACHSVKIKRLREAPSTFGRGTVIGLHVFCHTQQKGAPHMQGALIPLKPVTIMPLCST